MKKMDEIDKKSVKYFMTEMTQEEYSELYKYRFPKSDYETGLNRDERYLLNKIRSEHIQKLDKENG
jgi:hypothetical protein